MANTYTTYLTFWFTTASPADYEPPKPERLPFFLDPEQIVELTPEIDWTQRVNDRIEAWRKWALQPCRLAP